MSDTSLREIFNKLVGIEEFTMPQLKNIHLLAGGRQSSNETVSLLQTVFRDNGLASPTIAYVGTANRDDESFFQRTATTLRVAGAYKVNHALISPDSADLKKAKDTLHQ
ncbi:hypothetical protein MUP77_00355, partial [Candidatus Bathyarchaeota archaeon]|nr:hypothetical protein [Candidatus Bathyarchaeota archaeon]